MVEERAGYARRIEYPDPIQRGRVGIDRERREQGALAPIIVQNLVDDQLGQPVGRIVLAEDPPVLGLDELLVDQAQDIAAAAAPLEAVDPFKEAAGPLAPPRAPRRSTTRNRPGG